MTYKMAVITSLIEDTLVLYTWPSRAYVQVKFDHFFDNKNNFICDKSLIKFTEFMKLFMGISYNS